LSKSAEEGLAKVKEKANALIDEAASLKDPAKAKKQLQDLVKKFAKTPYAESVQKLLDELK
jgi:outer membrane protein assembly factor BamD (BamD/ComL family)